MRLLRPTTPQTRCDLRVAAQGRLPQKKGRAARRDPFLLAPRCQKPPHRQELVRAGGIEPPQVLRPYGFSYHFGFRRRLAIRRPFVVWTIPLPYPHEAGLRHCPSSLYTFQTHQAASGLARDYQERGFPEFEQFCTAGFPAGTRSRIQVRCVYQFRHARSAARVA